MDRFFKKDILYFIPFLFIIVAVTRAVITYNDIEVQEYNFAKSEAEVLNAFMMTHRRYYQHLYISHVIPLNEKTLQGLPAFSSSLISCSFTIPPRPRFNKIVLSFKSDIFVLFIRFNVLSLSGA